MPSVWLCTSECTSVARCFAHKRAVLARCLDHASGGRPSAILSALLASSIAWRPSGSTIFAGDDSCPSDASSAESSSSAVAEEFPGEAAERVGATAPTAVVGDLPGPAATLLAGAGIP